MSHITVIKLAYNRLFTPRSLWFPRFFPSEIYKHAPYLMLTCHNTFSLIYFRKMLLYSLAIYFIIQLFLFIYFRLLRSSLCHSLILDLPVSDTQHVCFFPSINDWCVLCNFKISNIPTPQLVYGLNLIN